MYRMKYMSLKEQTFSTGEHNWQREQLCWDMALVFKIYDQHWYAWSCLFGKYMVSVTFPISFLT